VALGLFAIMVTGCSSSASSSGVATGGVSCSQITGTVSFAPPLATSGKAAETTTVTLRASKCNTSDSDVSVVSGAATATINRATNACASLLTSKAITATVTWKPTSIRPTVVRFSGFSVTADKAGDAGFALPGPGHSVDVTGSFAGADHGARSQAVVFSSQPATQPLAACAQASGLSTIVVASGALTLG